MTDPFEALRTSADWPTLGRKALEDFLHDRGNPSDAGPAGGCFRCPTALLADSARALHAAGARLLTLAATLEADGEATLTYTFSIGTNRVLALEATSAEKTVDSLFSMFSTADFLEREVNHIFGLKFVGHPNLATLPAPPASPRNDPEETKPLTPRTEAGRQSREAPS